MTRVGLYSLLILLANLPLAAQHHDSPIKIFGYFQNNLEHQSETYSDTQANSFSLQQLNLFFQTDIEKNWRAFVNFEFLNNFSSSRQWGEANIEEAWIRFGLNEKLNLKFGLLLPAFNNLNEIKNRTPLLPYVVRPIVYETSFREFISVDQFTPEKAFAQVYGFIPVNETKFDYAVYVGNSPNINNSTENGQTGVDTTDTFLIGGRLGLRLNECKIGISVSRDNDNQLETLTPALGEPRSRFSEVPRTRLGADIAFHYHGVSLEGEKIVYKLANESEADVKRDFYYATLGYQFTESLFAYVSYFYTRERLINNTTDVESIRLNIPNVGLAYYLNENIRLKAQYLHAQFKAEVRADNINQKFNYHYFAMAISVIF